MCFRITCVKHKTIKNKQQKIDALSPTSDVLALDMGPNQNIHVSLICALWMDQKGVLACSLVAFCVCPAQWELLLPLPYFRVFSVSSPGLG